jgi:hypothetical protein
LKRTCPDFPASVLIVNVIVASGGIGFFASPFFEHEHRRFKRQFDRFG